jgi:phosphoesterase RecJ-like protein
MPALDRSATANILRRARQVLVLGHIRPDGDCIGSMIALGLGLQHLGVSVTVWSTEQLSPRYRFLPPIITPPTHNDFRRFDLIVIVDTPVLTRAAIDPAAFSAGVPTLLIDHHPPVDTGATYTCINAAESAAACIIYDLLVELDVPITKPIAAALYAGLLTDTGCFTYQNVNARTFEIAMALLASGVDTAAIATVIYNSMPATQLLLLREALSTLEFVEDGRGAFMWLSKDALARHGATSVDVEDFVNYPRSLASVQIAATLTEMPEDGFTRLSLRSKTADVNVNALARVFGGGGHVCASGAVLEEPLAIALPQFRAELISYLQQLPPPP